MEILVLMIPLGVLAALAIGAAFWWSADNGQFDDLDSPGQRLLMDDDRTPTAPEVPQSQRAVEPL